MSNPDFPKRGSFEFYAATLAIAVFGAVGACIGAVAAVTGWFWPVLGLFGALAVYASFNLMSVGRKV